MEWAALSAILAPIITIISTCIGVLWKQIKELQLSMQKAKDDHSECKIRVTYLEGQIILLNIEKERVQFESVAVIVINEQGFIREWNSGATTLFQYLQIEALGKHVSILIPERFHQAMNTAVQELLIKGIAPERGPHYGVGRLKNGTEIPVAMLYSGWRSASGERMFSAIVRIGQTTSGVNTLEP